MVTHSGVFSDTAGTPAPVRVTMADGVGLEGDLGLPSGAAGVVLFAHGSGSGRHSTRNRAVAASLRARGLGTLLLDLLTRDEEAVDERTRHLRFDIGLLGKRLTNAADWLSVQPGTRGLRIGLFGASTGAAAALITAAARPATVGAVVSRGGRPDLAPGALPLVTCPVLLIVGGADQVVLELNYHAMAGMRTDKRLAVVPDATHLFEEPGALEAVAQLACDWFLRHLAPLTAWRGGA